MKKPNKNEILIEIKWNSYDTMLLSAKLYRLIERKKIKNVIIDAHKGSLLTDLLIKGIEIEATLLFVEIVKYLALRIRKAREQKRDISSAKITLNNERRVIDENLY